MEIGTSMDDLRAVWDLCDFEKDGTLDLEEFTLALYLLKEAKQGTFALPPLSLFLRASCFGTTQTRRPVAWPGSTAFAFRFFLVDFFD